MSQRMIFPVVLVVAVLAAGCGANGSLSEVRTEEPPASPRLTEAQVLKLADDYAKSVREKHETFDLKDYPDRTAKFDGESGWWWVFYDHEPNRWPGDHFGLRVNDRTRRLEYFGGR